MIGRRLALLGDSARHPFWGGTVGQSPGAEFRCVLEDDGFATIRAVAAPRLVNSVADRQERRGYIHPRAAYVKDAKWRL
jgi:hypothetical protein